jgi:hypothetical protein
MRSFAVAFLVGGGALAMAMVACACQPSPKEPPREAPAAARARLGPRPPCPLGVPDATILAQETNDGVAVVFTSKDHEEELRQRVFDVSAQYGPGARFGKGHAGTHGLGGRHGLQVQELPPVTLSMNEIDGGARLRVTPVHPEDRDGVRAKVRARAEKLASDPCED